MVFFYNLSTWYDVMTCLDFRSDFTHIESLKYNDNGLRMLAVFENKKSLALNLPKMVSFV
jgi:hypothetical protein